MGRISNLFPGRRRRLERDLERELKYHLERRIEELVRSGPSLAESRRRALLEFGAMDRVQEEVREAWTWRWLDHLNRDVRHALRTLLRNPVFAVAAVLSLALGIGGNTAIFSLVDQVVLRRLPVPEAERIVHLDWQGTALANSWGDGNLMSYPLCRDLDAQPFFDGVFCRHPTTVSFSTGQQYESVSAEIVSGSYFPVLGVRAARGRLIQRSDDVKPGAHPVVVLSHRYWQESLGGASDVIGRRVLINSHPMEVIGIAPANFTGVDPVDAPVLWIPAAMKRQATPSWDQLENRRAVWMHVFARLRQEVSLEQARARVQPWFEAMLVADMRREGFPNAPPEHLRNYYASTIDVLPASRGLSNQRSALERPLWVLLAATSLLLLLACLNVAGLLVARGAARTQELTTRLALGASRAQVTRALLVESTIITIGGALLGLVLAPVVSGTLLSFMSKNVDVGFRIDRRVLLATFLVSLIAAGMCGLAPALQTRRLQLIASLKERAYTASGRGVRLRKMLVIGQLAFTLVLLIGAGLFVQTLSQLRAKDRGFTSASLVMFQVNPPALGFSDSAGTVLMNSLLQRLRSVPGVENVAIANTTILTGSGFRRTFTIGDERVVTERTVPGLRVSPGFFATLRARVVAGREFNEADTRDFADGYRSVVVNRSFARRYFGGRNPVGQRVGVGDRPDTPIDIEIVGLIEDISFRFIREDEPEHVFFPFVQEPSLASDGTFYLRVRGDPEASFSAIRASVAQINPALPIRNLTTLDDQIDRALSTERALATLSSGFGAIALLLSIVGLYGVMSFVVTERRREIGVRIALGAARSNAVWLITRDALFMIGTGVALALPASWALRRLVEAELFGVRAFDGSTIALASALLALVALGATLRPAWRAASVDPSEALRFE